MYVLMLKFSDGGHDITFVNGKRDRTIISDTHLLEKLMIGASAAGIKHRVVVWIEPQPDSDTDLVDDWWRLDNLETEEEAKKYLFDKPHLTDKKTHQQLVEYMEMEKLFAKLRKEFTYQIY